MKRITLCLLAIMLFTKSFSQEKGPALTKEYYMQKSKNQKITAWVLLGTGIGMILGGMAINYSSTDGGEDQGLWLSYLGGATALTSIPFFISGHKNKKRALSVAVSNQKNYFLSQNNIAFKPQPVISLTITLGK